MIARLDLPRTCGLVCASLAACGGGHGANQANGGADGTTGGSPDAASASDEGGGSGPDGGPWCPGPLPDAGFSSLADLPIASLCRGSYVNGLSESKRPCQGSIVVSISEGVDCGGWWLFDAKTGALEAVGGGCAGGTGPGCTGAVAGLQFPYQCFLNGGWPESVELCSDAGADAGSIADAAADAAD